MKISAKPFLVALLVLTTALSGLTPARATSTAFYNDCGVGSVVKPKSITEFCADGGAGVTNIQWSSWGASSAKGTGTFYINGCDPYCAAGKISKTKVNVLLSGLTKTHGKSYLMHVTVTPLTGKKFIWPPSMKPVPNSVTWVTDYWQG